mmetsp:Transcript_9566/g.29567  ORF Transcript_9566/g.29567 Transcript_9566/m.29567 type:complete len:287 (+) Transcript_9566:493-1353(+)
MVPHRLRVLLRPQLPAVAVGAARVVHFRRRDDHVGDPRRGDPLLRRFLLAHAHPRRGGPRAAGRLLPQGHLPHDPGHHLRPQRAQQRPRVLPRAGGPQPGQDGQDLLRGARDHHRRVPIDRHLRPHHLRPAHRGGARQRARCLSHRRRAHELGAPRHVHPLRVRLPHPPDGGPPRPQQPHLRSQRPVAARAVRRELRHRGVRHDSRRRGPGHRRRAQFQRRHLRVDRRALSPLGAVPQGAPTAGAAARHEAVRCRVRVHLHGRRRRHHQHRHHTHRRRDGRRRVTI